MPPLRRLALVEPIGDVGIGGYTHELAEALCGHGVRVDVYSRPDAFALRLPRAYRLLPILGLPSADAAAVLAGPGAPPPAPEPPPPDGSYALEPYFDALDRLEARRRTLASPVTEPTREPAAASNGETSAGSDASPSPVSSMAARRPPSADARGRTRGLVHHLCGAGYDAVWMQWPEFAGFSPGLFRRLSQAVPVVHTAHNVLPHEGGASGARASGEAYRAAQAVVVHSRFSAGALARTFPVAGGKVLPSWHGLYTMFPRAADARERVRARLCVAPGEPLFLCFGGVRPYKNVESVVEALADPRCRDLTLVVAGSEWGYPDLVLGDRLGRTRRLAERHGVRERVRLLPGSFGLRQAAELFEAADAVVLPYAESYGSGVLLLAMSFGKHVVATDAGGMDEYLAEYPSHTLLSGPAPAHVADGLARAAAVLGTPPSPRPARFEWPAVTAELLPLLAGQYGR